MSNKQLTNPIYSKVLHMLNSLPGLAFPPVLSLDLVAKFDGDTSSHSSVILVQLL